MTSNMTCELFLTTILSPPKTR